ncbi:MAG: cytochrome c-type biogenesis protein CcmH [Kyrpidia sp.]|uniref:Cytochrome c-type biogenesis protein n=2 Tax=Alicyclobacillaceae TaxID=186823 RepID=A0A6F9EG60_9BACL|nr:cytochrome c-type biogenesis protein CcmH [Kyrpidia sp.]CAB3395405.1 Cytochrome c-type biogenesis protein [Kyrpidia spormannii]
MTMFQRLIAIAALLSTLLLATPVLAAGQTVTWQDVLDIASQYHPPGCPPSLTGATCQEKQAYDLRIEIFRLLEQGKTPAEIRQILVSEYGNDILAAPPAQGVGALVWAVPAVVIILGLGIFILIVRGRRPPVGG